jgi:hypothetical protein
MTGCALTGIYSGIAFHLAPLTGSISYAQFTSSNRRQARDVRHQASDQIEIG